MIGLSTTYYATKGLTIYESVSKVVELGFNNVELGAAHTYEENVWETLYKIKNDFKDVVFTIHSLFPPFDKKIWFNPADGLNEINKEIIDRLFKSAEILEASLISIHPPILNEISLRGKFKGNFDKPLIGAAKNKNIVKKCFLSLMEYTNKRAKEYNIKVVIENLNNSYLNTLLVTKDDFLEIFKEFENTGFLLDVGHALQCGNLSELKELDGKIFEMHLHDVSDFESVERLSHLPIREISYFEPFQKIMTEKSIPLIFEHGSNVSEEEIVEERELLEKFLKSCRGKSRTSCL